MASLWRVYTRIFATGLPAAVSLTKVRFYPAIFAPSLTAVGRFDPFADEAATAKAAGRREP